MLRFRFFQKISKRYRELALEFLNSFKFASVKSGIAILIFAVIIWMSIFAYIAFYYAYMPAISHIKPVHLQFKRCADEDICSFPTAHIQLTKKQQFLMIGQPYKMSISLDMPESQANKELGMFMVCMQLHDKDQSLIANSCRSTMLHYRSYLLHTLNTLFYSPVMLLGSLEERQNIRVELFSDFEEDQNRPITDAYVEIQSRKVQLYGAVLHIHAQFTGLRFLMFHWPILSAFVGISSNLFFFTIILGLSWSHFGFLDNIIWMEDSENNSEDDDESEKKLKHVDSFDDISLPEHKRAPEIESLNDSQETTSSQEFLDFNSFE